MRHAPLSLLPGCHDYDRGRDLVVCDVRSKDGKFATNKNPHGSIHIDAIIV
jgi:hypothetical protein